MKIVDLSRELYHRTPSYPGHPPVMHGVWKTHEESFAESGNVWGLASMFISMVDHAGTHIDAPRHFGPGGIPINEYPLEKCIVPGICLDLRHIAPRAEIAPGDLKAAVAKAGHAVQAGDLIFIRQNDREIVVRVLRVPETRSVSREDARLMTKLVSEKPIVPID